MKGVRKSQAVEKASATRIKSDGIALVGKVVSFHASNFSSEFPTYKLKDVITLLPTHVDKMSPQPGMLRFNEQTKLREVYCKVDYDKKDDKVVEYFAYHVEQSRRHGKAYTGPVPNLTEYWDETNGKMAAHVWFPFEDALGNTPLVSAKLWDGAYPPEMRTGNVISIVGRFAVYIQIPKAQGAAIVKERAEKELEKAKQFVAQTTAMVVSAPDDNGPPAAEDVTGEAPSGGKGGGASEPKRHPSISLGFNGSNGCSYHDSNRLDCSPYEALMGDFDNRRHFLRLPESNYDSAGLVIPVVDYQNYSSWDQYEPGPSTARRVNVSFAIEDYQKAPKGQDAEKTPMREAKKRVSVDVLQYNGKVPDPGAEFPFTVQFNVFTAHTLGTGITNLEQWLKFGRQKWQGVAVVSVDAAGTRSTELFKNNRNDAKANEWAGHLECWVKNVVWDVESSVRSFGFPVQNKADFLGRLYADIYQEAENKKTKTTIIQLPMERLQRKLNPAIQNPLHLEKRVINLGEWTSEAGWIVSSDDYELFVVLHLPIPQDLLRDPVACEEYTEAASEVFRDMSEEDFVNVILGENGGTAFVELGDLGKREILVYHPDEIACFKAIEDAEKRAPALPGRGPMTRTFADRNARSGARPPASYDFDFAVYALPKAPEKEVPMSPKRGTTTKT
jgi:hypothetical protein